MKTKENYFITKPTDTAKKYHIFDRDNQNRSLCGSYGMLFVNPNMIEDFTGNETYNEKQDCKKCFEKAGLQSAKLL